MTGRELIIYILQNNLEDVNLYDTGIFPGWTPINEFAMKYKVGLATVYTWEQLGWVKLMKIGDTCYASEPKGVQNNG